LPQSYEELLDLFIQTGQIAEARAVLAFLLHASTVRTKDADLNRKLEVAQKLLHYSV